MTAAEILESIRPGASALLADAQDLATVQRVARNLAAWNAGQLTAAEAAGIFSVNVDELLEVIGRLSRRTV